VSEGSRLGLPVQKEEWPGDKNYVGRSGTRNGR